METLKNFKNKIQIALKNFSARKVTKTKVNFIEVQPLEVLVSVEVPIIEDQLSTNEEKTLQMPNGNNDDEKNNKNAKTEHMKGINFIIGIVNLCGSVLGLQADKNWKFNILTLFTFCLTFSFSFLVFYSIYLFKDNFFKIIECVSLMGVLAPGVFKLHLTCTSVKEGMAVYEFVEDVYRLNSYGVKAEILSKNTQRILKRIIFLIVMLVIGFVCYAGYPIYKLLCDGELIPILTLEVPFVDQSTTFGLVFADILMLTVGLYGVLGSIAFDVFFALNVMLYSSLVKMLKHDFEQLENMWGNQDESTGVDYRNAFLRNILVKFVDVDLYVRSISSIYSGFLFAQMAAAYSCISLALFAVAVLTIPRVNVYLTILKITTKGDHNHWMSGVGFTIFCFVEMFLLCYLGTTITIQNDELRFIIYEHPWHLYPAKTQKLFISLLYIAQHSKELTIGSFALLNVETDYEEYLFLPNHVDKLY